MTVKKDVESKKEVEKKVEPKLKYLVLRGFKYTDKNGNDTHVKPFIKDSGKIQYHPVTGERLQNVIEIEKSLVIPFLKSRCLEEIYEDE